MFYEGSKLGEKRVRGEETRMRGIKNEKGMDRASGRHGGSKEVKTRTNTKLVLAAQAKDTKGREIC